MTRGIILYGGTLVFCLLSGCGGGGGSSPAPPSPPTTTNPPPDNEQDIVFTRAVDAGLNQRSFGGVLTQFTDPERFSGGIAAADYDDDGDVDLYVVGGNTDPNHLYQDQGDGTYDEVAASVGLDLVHWGSGPAFGDIDGDGDLDLFIGAVEGDPISLFENRIDQDGMFVDITANSGIVITAFNTVGGTFFDYDRDGYLDLFLTHWGNPYYQGDDTETVWRNNGDSTFTNLSIESGIAATQVENNEDYSYSPNFSDIDGDGDSDLLMSSDFNDSQVYLNNSDGTFTNITDTDVIKDQAGMGGAVGDFDNDTDNGNHFLNIRLQGAGNNHLGIGAHITVTTDEVAQVREMGGKNHYVSHSPYEVHFGLGSASTADILIRWPDGTVTDLLAVDADQHLVISQP